MKSTDIIYIRVAGTNPSTREQKRVSKRFNGIGQELADNGEVLAGGATLKGLAEASSAGEMPVMPAAYFKAQEDGDIAKIKQLLTEHSEKIAAWQSANGGGSPEVRLAKAALQYCYDNEGFLPNDGNGYVLKLENLDVKTDTIKEGGYSVFMVAGTAIFG